MLRSFLVGIKDATRNWQMILLLLVASFVIAIPAAVPVFLVIALTSRGTLAPSALLGDKIQIGWLIDLFNSRFDGASLASSAAEVGVLLLIVTFFYLLLNVFFAGGIIEVLAHRNGVKFSLRRFWAGAGAGFPRFFRLWIFSSILYAIAIGAFVFIIMMIIDASEESAREKPGSVKALIALSVLLLVLMIINMVFDYARIGAVLNQRYRMLREILLAFKFSFRHFLTTFGLYLMIALAGGVLFLLLTAGRAAIIQNSLVAAFLAFVVAQIAIAARLWNRIAFYAAQIDLYGKLGPETVAAAPQPQFPKPEFRAANSDCRIHGLNAPR